MGRAKILFLIPSLSQGGAERQILELMRRLDPSRFETALCTFHDDAHYAELRPAGTAHHDLGARGRLTRAGFNRLLDVLRSERPDIVQSFMDQANLWIRLAGPLAGAPAVVTSVRGPWMRWRYLAVEGILAERLAEAVVVNSRSTYDELVLRANVPPTKLRIIHNFLDLDRFQPPSSAARAEARRHFGLADDDLVLLLGGRISLQKHHLGLALALGRLRSRGVLPPRARVLLAGRPRDGWYARLVGPAFKAAGVDGMVRNLGSVPSQEMTGLYAASDVLLLPSLWEGLPNVALEAQACGLPVVLSEAANRDGIVEDGVTGFSAPLELDMESFTDALGRMVALPPERRAEMGARGRERVIRNFHPSVPLADFTALYEQIMEARSSRPTSGRLPALG